MPCILVEVAFLTNETEGQRIAARRYQEDIAEGIASGIRRFLASDTANSNL
jgi:N-acetylmuramoyl-L-alanine amidase